MFVMLSCCLFFLFFFSSRRRHTRCSRDWSSDVCSSDLIRYFIHFHGKRHPAEMGAAEVTAFLSWLATERNVATATQNQALSALLFLYKHEIGRASCRERV